MQLFNEVLYNITLVNLKTFKILILIKEIYGNQRQFRLSITMLYLTFNLILAFTSILWFNVTCIYCF